MSFPEFDELSPLVGHAWVLGDGISATEMVRAVQAARGSATPFARGDFVVAGLGVGGDDGSRVHVATLRTVGVAAVVARSFGAHFYQESIARGLPALIIEEAEAIQPGDRLRIDIEQHKIANQSSGDRYIIRNLYDDEELDILRAGGLAAYRAQRATLSGGSHQ